MDYLFLALILKLQTHLQFQTTFAWMTHRDLRIASRVLNACLPHSHFSLGIQPLAAFLFLPSPALSLVTDMNPSPSALGFSLEPGPPPLHSYGNAGHLTDSHLGDLGHPFKVSLPQPSSL